MARLPVFLDRLVSSSGVSTGAVFEVWQVETPYGEELIAVCTYSLERVEAQLLELNPGSELLSRLPARLWLVRALGEDTISQVRLRFEGTTEAQQGLKVSLRRAAFNSLRTHLNPDARLSLQAP
ncbi:MAG: hypothetical protein R3B54_05660 [Bdellovibrionota bacterium]